MARVNKAQVESALARFRLQLKDTGERIHIPTPANRLMLDYLPGHGYQVVEVMETGGERVHFLLDRLPAKEMFNLLTGCIATLRMIDDGHREMKQHLQEWEIDRLVTGFRQSWEAIADDVLSMEDSAEVPRDLAYEMSVDANRPEGHGVSQLLMTKFYNLPHHIKEVLKMVAFPDETYGY